MTNEERKKRVAELKEHHQSYFDSIGESKARFTAKMLYGNPEKSKFFYSEIGNDSPLYVEFVTRDYVPQAARNLYVYKFRADYDSFFIKEQTESGLEMYVVPFENFTKVASDEEPVKQLGIAQGSLDLDFDIINPDEDCPMDNITLRDWASILLRVPVSRKEWLNKLIKESCQK